MNHLEPCPELATFSALLLAGPPVDFGRLFVVPILGRARIPDVDLLGQSIPEGRTEVTEISEGGAVPEVTVKHVGPHTLLLLDGEILVGAKQNRVLNASLLVPAGASVKAPVSCVERGRWRYRSAHFEASPAALSSKLRSAKLRRVASAVACGRGYDADQSAVWRDVDAHLEETTTSSETSSYTDSHDARAGEIEAALPRIAPIVGQIGIAVVCGGAVVAIDVFGSAALFKRAWRRIARGILGDVHAEAAGSAVPGDPGRPVREILASLGSAKVARTRAPGAGETLHGDVGGHAVGAVVAGGRVYHMAVG